MVLSHDLNKLGKCWDSLYAPRFLLIALTFDLAGDFQDV